MIDANAYLGEWPFRRLEYTTPESLLRKMDSLGIERAVVSRLENVFFKDLLVGNRELHAIVRRFPDRFIPAYTINPAFPGWEEDLEICRQEFGLRFLRLHPNYHQYRLMEEPGQAILERARAEGLVVIITLGLEDPRHHHWLVKVPNVATSDIQQALNAFSDVRVLIAGGNYGEVTAIWQGLVKKENVFVENSRVQGPVGDVELLCGLMGADHVLFGTNLPLHYPEAAKLSIDYAQLSPADKAKLFHHNAARLFGEKE
jgi:predicted TIM-barrel fold metal-dependent hydrolase